MKKGIEHVADRALHHLCLEKSQEVAMSGVEGSASAQLEIRKIADRVIDYALEAGTAYGVIEVAFSNKPWKGLTELYLQCPTTVTFSNFIPEKDDVDQDTMLVKHLIVVNHWSNAIKVFKATIENERVHLMLYSAIKKPKI